MSDAKREFQKALGHTDRLIEGTKSTRGKPTDQEATMFVASVAFAYAAWESYIEDVAVEAVRHLADNIDPAKVPAAVQKSIEKRAGSSWALAVHPGWKHLWVQQILEQAKGDDSGYGLNTARAPQVRGLFAHTGLDPFKTVSQEALEQLNELVTARGSVVHSASAPEAFKKGKAREYRDLVVRLVEAVDATLNDQVAAYGVPRPW